MQNDYVKWKKEQAEAQGAQQRMGLVIQFLLAFLGAIVALVCAKLLPFFDF